MIGRLGCFIAALWFAACGGDAVETGGSCGCLETGLIDWGSDGGFSVAQPRSALSACRKFSHHSGIVREGDFPQKECAQQLWDCSNAAGPGDVAAALRHPDVQAAIALGQVGYGVDHRGVDGPIFNFRVGSSWIGVGGACQPEDSSCTPIPDGVAALAMLLKMMTTQELARGTCAEVFGPRD